MGDASGASDVRLRVSWPTVSLSFLSSVHREPLKISFCEPRFSMSFQYIFERERVGLFENQRERGRFRKMVCHKAKTNVSGAARKSVE